MVDKPHYQQLYETVFKLDSGADVMVVHKEIYENMADRSTLLSTSKTLYCQLKHRDKFKAILEHQRKSYAEEIYILDDLDQSLLGRFIFFS